MSYLLCNRKPQKSGGEVVEIINPIQSVRISTNQTFALTYGKVVLRAKLSRGDWLWPCNMIFFKYKF